MYPVASDNFGLLIGYLIPGFLCLWTCRPFLGTAGAWFGDAASNAPTVGGFLFATLASVAAGLVLSALRWAVLDRLHHLTGVREPAWDFSRLPERFQAFEGIVENHYRFYQFYGNSLVALVIVSGVWASAGSNGPLANGWRDIGIAAVAMVLWVASRDTLRKYYARAGALLSAADEQAGSGTTHNR